MRSFYKAKLQITSENIEQSEVQINIKANINFFFNFERISKEMLFENMYKQSG